MDSSPESIREQLEGSLKRLKVGCIDLYYQHRIELKVEPEIVAGVMKELIAEGKIKHWGLSNAPIPGTTKLHRLEENIGTADLQLTEKELISINEAISKINFEKYY